MAHALGVSVITSSAVLSVVPRLAPHAEKAGIKVSFHNHSTIRANEFATPDDFAAAMKVSPMMGATLDIGHFTAANFDAVAYLGQHHDRINALHIKDRKRDQGPNVPFGEGDTPIAAVLRLLRDRRWDIPAHIEYEYKGGDAVAAFAASGGDSAKFLSALTQSGDLEGAQAFQEYTLKQQKDKADIRSKGITDAKGLQELRVRTAQSIKAGGTVDHVMQGIRELQAIGDEEGVRFLTSGLEQNPNPTREHIAAYLDPVISSGLSAEQFSMPSYKDTGGQLVNVNPNSQFAPINKTQTPESLASNQVSREGHKVSREGHAVTMRGQDLTNARAKDTETRLSTAQQRLDQQNEQAISGAKGSKALISEMRQLVKDNPRGTATPLAGPARLAESMKGVFDPGAKAGPAIRFNQLRDTLLATVDGLRRDGRMSNQDRQRLENAVGSGMTTPANTVEALNTVEDIIDRMGGSQAQAADPQNDYLARRKKLLGY